MSMQEDVIKIGKKLEKMVANGTTDDSTSLDMLNMLRKMPMKLEVLQKTRIGMTVNNFRKACNNDETVSLAKTLIKNWKKLLPGDGGGGGSQSSQSAASRQNSTSSVQRSNSTTSSVKDDDSRDSRDSTSSTGDGQKVEPPAEKPEPVKRQPSGPSMASETSDPVRIKCRELLANALKTPPLPEGCAEPEDMAAEIEDSIFDEFKNTEVKYKNRVRSRMANLKDTKNPKLREGVLLGLIPPDRIAKMNAEEMASDSLKELRAKLTKEAIDDHQMTQQGGTRTTLFKCGKCGKRDCSYNQVQTRSADEPMTTFVLCNECGNRWKFC